MQIRCSNCNKLLGDYEQVNGIVKCYRCKTLNNLNIVTQQYQGVEYVRREKVIRFTR